MAVEQMQKLFISLCLLATVSLAADTVCYPVECKLSTQTFTSETCAYWDKASDIYYLEACSSTSYCPSLDFEDPANSTCATTPTTTLNKYPGEKCTATSDCDTTYATGGCVGGVCVGISANGNCTHYGECEPGYYCGSEGKCISQVKVGGQCENDFQCINGAGCNITTTATYGTCVSYFSVDDHARVATCNSTLNNYLCASTMCDTDNGEAICLSSVKSKMGNLLPMICENNDQCESSADPVTGYIYTLDCVCGLNKHGYSFCNQWPGDPDFAHLIQMWKKWVFSTNVDKCNTLRRQNFQCIADWWDSNDMTLLNYFSLKTNYWPYLQMNDDCTQNMFLSDYYKVQESYNALRNTTDPDDHHETSSAILLGFSLPLLAYA
ncbi:unnamed protein product [Blepharisma stoltei]|uniref:Uncharacterized protein n=1 Tax=Blepharisma stoltei TaxID=1481888 RepID=A0AAU9JV90_9CILI|nr:unnamed protein product [Blepharisma stoltei]